MHTPTLSTLLLQSAKRLSLFLLPLLMGTAVIFSGLALTRSAHAQQQPDTRQAKQTSFPSPSDALLRELEAIYTDIHANPELAMQESRTAKIAADWLRKQGFDVTEKVGGTGVVGILRNGKGSTVLLRADMDALAMKEDTGLPYASTKVANDPSSGSPTPVAHSCGHDMHVTWLMGVTRMLAENRDNWRGTVMALFQPAEETGTGARAMIDDGMVKRFPKPDVVMGQHVMPLRAGQIGTRVGLLLSMSDSLDVKLFGRGGHGSSPEKTIDPVVMAAAAVMRLQTVVSREVGITQGAVVSVGALQAGSSGNIIPSEATLRLNVRTFDEQVRKTVLGAIRRIINAEAAASNAPKPPAFEEKGRFPPTYNDKVATPKVVAALKAGLGADQVGEIVPASASEDFSWFARAWDVPAVYWAVGGTDPKLYERLEREGRPNEIPSNHSPQFAPVLTPTLRRGVDAMLAATGPWLAP
jgi:amidohydrolase